MALPDSPLKADSWPSKLIMQLLPQTLLVSIQAHIREVSQAYTLVTCVTHPMNPGEGASLV